MKIFSVKMITAIIALAICISTLLACSTFSGGNSSSGNTSGTGWKVWVKTSPCSVGRTDWITVAKENPTVGGGGSFWQTADLIQNPQACTLISDNSCTFAQADASASVIRASSRFSSYCCSDWSVWRNTASGEMSIVKGSGSAGFGWQLEKGSMCCEDAQAMTGKTGLCDGAPPLGPVVSSRTPVTNTTVRQNNNTTINSSDDDNYNSYPNHNSVTTRQTPPPLPPTVSGRWTFVSVTAIPEQKSGWTYNAQSSSARYVVYNGDINDFQWTKPPPEIDANGFSISVSVQCKSQPNNRCSQIIGVSGKGIDSSGERKAEAYGENGAVGSGQKTVSFKPSPNADELEVEIGLGWGDVRFIYKYRRL